MKEMSEENAEFLKLSEPESVGLVLNKSGLMCLNMLNMKMPDQPSDVM